MGNSAIYTKHLGADVTVMDFAVIYENVVIGDGVTVGESNVIGKIPTPTSMVKKKINFDDVLTVISSGCRLCSHVTIYSNVHLGENCLVGDNCSIFTDVKIANEVLIGRNVTVGYEVSIGKNTRIMDGSHITGRSTIGANVFISVGVSTANDNSFGKRGFSEEAQGVCIGDYVSIGQGAIIMPGVSIGKGSIVAAGSVVKGSFGEQLLIAGNPAREISKVPSAWSRIENA